MPEFQGKTGEVKIFKLQSILVSVRWGSAEAPIGGRVSLEALTQFVSDGSELNLSIKNLEGKEIDKIKGKVYTNYFRTQLTLKSNPTGGIFAEVELPAHKLKGRTPALKLLPLLEIKNLKWLDEAEAELNEAADNQRTRLIADIKALDGKEAHFSVFCKRGDTPNESLIALETSAKIEAGKAKVDWTLTFKDKLDSIKGKPDLKKEGLNYFQPVYFFTVECMGVLAKSPDLKLAHVMTLLYESEPGKAGVFEGKNITVIAPDGATTKHPIPNHGKIEIRKTLPGIYDIDESEVQEFL